MNLSIQANENSNEFRISSNGDERSMHVAASINELVNDALKPVIEGTTRRDIHPDRYTEDDHWGGFNIDFSYATDWKAREAIASKIINCLGDDLDAAMSDLNAQANYLEALADSLDQLTEAVKSERMSREYKAKAAEESADMKELIAGYESAGVKRLVATHVGATRNRDEDSNLVIGDVLRMANPNKSYYAVKTYATYGDDRDWGRNENIATSDNQRPWLKFVVTGLNANSVECSVNVDLEMLKGFATVKEFDHLDEPALILQYHSAGTILPSRIGSAFNSRSPGAAHHRDVSEFLASVAESDEWTILSNGTAVLNYIVEFKCVDKYQHQSSNYPQGTVYNGNFKKGYNNLFGVLVSATPNEAKEEADRS